MKKFLALLLLTPVFFIACSEDEEENKLKLNTTEVTLSYEETYRIDAYSDATISYASKNPYHATVSKDGLITAGFVGETTILVQSGNESVEFKVTVAPKYTLFDTPFIKWETTQKEIINKFGIDGFYNKENNYIDYLGLNTSDVYFTRFFFDDNDLLASTAIYLKNNSFSQAALALHERYLYEDRDELEDGRVMNIFGNALDFEDADMLVATLEIDDSYFAIIFMPVQKETDTQRSTRSKKATMERIAEKVKKATK